MNRTLRPISLAGSELEEMRHVCAFFADDEEEYKVLLPFIRGGFACGDRAIHVVNPGQRNEHLQRLAEDGIDTVGCQQSGQLNVHNNTDIYLRDGRFDQDRMLAAFEELASGSSGAAGFPLSRIICRMEWMYATPSCIEDVIEFEARVNDVWRVHDDAVICTYRLSMLSGDEAIDILRTHPLVLIGSMLQQNPFFMPPEEFLHDFRRRRSGRMSHV